MRIGRILVVAVSLLVATSASAALKTRVVEYSHEGTELQGYMAWDDAKSGKRPGVLVVHEWWGHNEHARGAAERLARAGYVAFALDMFGKGKLATHAEDAQKFVAESMEGAKLPGRFNAALDILKAEPTVDPARIGAIGYCYGGAVALGMARAGADLKAVATFHGALATSSPAEAGKMKSKVLVMTGAADPMVPADQVAGFEKEMKAAGVSYRVIAYPGAKHGFTNPNADKTGITGLGYDASADKKSWAELLKFFKKEL